MATPAPPSGDIDDESLVFMTHAPGAVVPKRELAGIDVNDSFAGKILGKFGIKTNQQQAKADAGSQESLTGRLAKGAAEGAGKGALDRALAASRRSTNRQQPAKEEQEPGWTDKTWAGQNLQIQDQTPKVMTAAPTAGAPTGPAEPSFLAQLPGALLTPLRGFVVVAVNIIIMGLALLLLELSPLMGLAAIAIASVMLIALRVRVIRETAAGRHKVGWPDVGAVFSALLPFIAAGVVAVPALLVGVAAYAPNGAFMTDNQASLPQRVSRLFKPVPIQEGESPDAPGVRFGQATYIMLEAAVGVVDAQGPSAPTRPTAEVARDLADSARQRAKTLVDGANATPMGIAARALAVLAFCYFPMAFLCAVRLRSAYAAVHVPLVLRSILRVMGPYLVVLFLFALQLAATAAAILLLPAQLADAGSGGHFGWVAAVATVLVAFPLIVADLLGRLYHTRQISLGWD